MLCRQLTIPIQLNIHSVNVNSSHNMAIFGIDLTRGGARHFHLGGPLEGPVLQQGELSMVCVGLSERDLLQWHDITRKILWGPLGGPGKILEGQWPPWHPPSSAPGFNSAIDDACLQNYSEQKLGLLTK